MKVEGFSLVMDSRNPVNRSHKPAHVVRSIGCAAEDGGVMHFDQPLLCKEQGTVIATIVELSDEVVSHIFRAGNEIACRQKATVVRQINSSRNAERIVIARG